MGKYYCYSEIWAAKDGSEAFREAPSYCRVSSTGVISYSCGRDTSYGGKELCISVIKTGRMFTSFLNLFSFTSFLNQYLDSGFLCFPGE